MSKFRRLLLLLATMAVLIPNTANAAGIFSTLLSKLGLTTAASKTSGGTSYMSPTSTVGKCGYDATRAGSTGYNPTQKR